MSPKKYTGTPLMDELAEKMEAHGLTNSSKLTYLRILEYLHGKPIEDLSFFTNKEAIDEKMDSLKPNTKRVYYTAIHSALKLSNPDPTSEMKELISHYHKKMMRIAQYHKKIANRKSKTQQENWIEWQDVTNKWDEMKIDFDILKSKGAISREYEYQFLLHFIVLTLYVKMIPRRNADYLNMIISQKEPEVLDDEHNYLILDDKKFVFNRYKTSAVYGRQDVSIPDFVLDILYFYIFSRHQEFPHLSSDLKKGKTFPFIVLKNLHATTESNAITRCLNRIFSPKKIGSSMLRTIFATDMLHDDQVKCQYLAEGMGHSVKTQQNIYVKQPHPAPLSISPICLE